MHAIEALMAGVRGAENGTASVYSHGTTSPANVYSDFDGTAVVSGLDISLDGDGRSVVYVNETVDVVVYDSGGVQVLSYTSSAGAGNVEYRGSAFTGESSSGQSGAGSSYPVTLQDVLGAALTSFGAVDWKVLVNGTATPLQDAIAGMAGIFYNVKAYGAEGDGIANDSAGVQAAIDAADAAGGGMVFFPPGDYLLSTNVTVPPKVSIVGAGSRATRIGYTGNTGHCLTLEAHDSIQYPPRLVQGIHVAAVQTNSDACVALEASARVVFRDCAFYNSGITGRCVYLDTATATQAIFENCRFSLATTSTANMLHSASSAVIKLSKCWFYAPATYNPTDAIVYANHITIEGCEFDCSASTSGTIPEVVFNSTTIYASITGCRFTSATGATVTAIVLGTYASGTRFTEDGNVFGATITAYSYTVAAASAGATVRLGTRESRYLAVTVAASPYTVPFDQYGVISITSTVAGNVSLSINAAPPGAHGNIWVLNDDGSARNFTPGGSAVFTAIKAIGAAAVNAMICDSTINDGVVYVINVWIQ